MKAILMCVLACAACGGSVDAVAWSDVRVEPDGGTYVACRPLDEPDAALRSTLVWVAPGPKSDWAPCEGETPQGQALWCCAAAQ